MQRRTACLRCVSWLTAVLVAALLIDLPDRSEAGEARLRAGVVQTDITPEKPVKMSGYSGRKSSSTGVHDRLFARVVVFESGGRRLVLVSTDLIGYYESVSEVFRKEIGERFGLKPGELFLCGTHSHSAPTPTLSETADPNNVEYTQGLKKKLLETIGRAMENLVPIQLGAGSGSSPVGVNRRELTAEAVVRLGRNAYGPTDKEVLVIKLATPDGKPLAAVFDYATHATSLGPGNLQISGDVLGLASQFVEKSLGQGIIAPAFAGASGDIDPWYRVLPGFNTENGRISEPEVMGMMLGHEVMHVFGNIKSMSSDKEIRTDFVTLNLPAKKLTEQDRMRDKERGREPEKDSSTRPFNLTVARIGDIGFVGLGCELLTEVGMAIKAGSPFDRTFVITHCNGSSGYLPPKHLYNQGGYEVDSTRFGPQAAELVVKQARQMLYALK